MDATGRGSARHEQGVPGFVGHRTVRRRYLLSQRFMKPSRPWGMKMTIAMKIIPTGIR